jgi:hypothetical protein
MGLAGGLATNGELTGGSGGSGVSSLSNSDGYIGVSASTGSVVLSEGATLSSTLALLAPKASPTFTGTVTVPTTVNSTDAAQKAYVDGVAQLVAGTGLAKSANTLSVLNTVLVPTNALYETFSRDLNFSSIAIPTTTDLYLSAIALPTGLTIGHLHFVSGPGAVNTPTNWWFALYDNNFNLLAITADQTSATWAINTDKSLAIATIASGSATSFTTTYTGLHYLGVMQKATTCVQIAGIAPAANAGVNALAPVLAGISNTGLSVPQTFPTTATALTGAAGQLRFYGYVAT